MPEKTEKPENQPDSPAKIMTTEEMEKIKAALEEATRGRGIPILIVAGFEVSIKPSMAGLACATKEDQKKLLLALHDWAVSNLEMIDVFI